MSVLLIEDLTSGPSLDSQEMSQVTGGFLAGLGQETSSGDVAGAIGIESGGISLFSPTIATNVVIDASVDLNIANILQESLNMENYTNSVIV